MVHSDRVDSLARSHLPEAVPRLLEVILLLFWNVLQASHTDLNMLRLNQGRLNLATENPIR